MGYNKLELFVHFVWGTWDRHPLLTSDIERPVYRLIQERAQALGCTVLALNGMEDHVHLVLRITATLSVSEIMKEVKGSSSLVVNETIHPSFRFKWQGGYGAFTVNKRNLPPLIAYVKNQKEHHANNTLYATYELS